MHKKAKSAPAGLINLGKMIEQTSCRIMFIWWTAATFIECEFRGEILKQERNGHVDRTANNQTTRGDIATYVIVISFPQGQVCGWKGTFRLGQFDGDEED